MEHKKVKRFAITSFDVFVYASFTVKITFTSKVKVKCTLVQALRLCTGRTAHKGSRGIALLYRQ
jgi:hypothetical protein